MNIRSDVVEFSNTFHINFFLKNEAEELITYQMDNTGLYQTSQAEVIPAISYVYITMNQSYQSISKEYFRVYFSDYLS